MCTVSIHADEVFVNALRVYAGKIGKSVNRTVQDLLAPILGVQVEEEKIENPYLTVCGVLSKDDASKLQISLDEQRKIDEDIWK